MDYFETEMKFPIPEYGKEELVNRLKALGAKDLGRHFENNVILEDESNYLNNNDYLLRIRETENKTILTLKGKKKKDSNFKIREEIETVVDNFDNILKILSMLRFKPQRVYQKYRRTMKLSSTTITIDELPFGEFIEIEGSKNDITNLASTLKLETTEISNMTYFALYELDCKRKGKNQKKHITFSGYDISKIVKE